MKPVIIESPLAGETAEQFVTNRRYLLWVCRHVAMVEENAPFAGHAIMPQFLDDRNTAERKVGIDSHLCIGEQFQEAQFWIDMYPGRPVEMTNGMHHGMRRWTERRMRVRTRQLERVNSVYYDKFLKGEWPPSTPGFQVPLAVRREPGDRALALELANKIEATDWDEWTSEQLVHDGIALAQVVKRLLKENP